MDTKELLKYAAVAAAGWWAWSKYGEQLGLPAISTLLPGGSTPTPSTTGPVNNQTVATTASYNIERAMAEQAQKEGWGHLANADEWGWMYAKVRGAAAPDPTTIHTWPNGDGSLDTWDRNFKMTIAEYVASAGSALHGLNGIIPYRYNPKYIHIAKQLNAQGRVANG